MQSSEKSIRCDGPGGHFTTEWWVCKDCEGKFCSHCMKEGQDRAAEICDACYWPQQPQHDDGDESSSTNPDRQRMDPMNYATRGIPPRERPSRWWKFSGYGEVPKFTEKYSEVLSAACHPLAQERMHACVRQIMKDISRCPLLHPFFVCESAKRMCVNVLTAYAYVNPATGYCQSLATMAMLLLFVLREEGKAFFLLYALVEKKFPAEYFSCYKMLEGVRADQWVVTQLMARYMPEVHHHLMELKFFSDHQDYAVPWLMGAFTTIANIPLETVLRIWDAFIIMGQEVLLRAALWLVHVNRQAILECRDAVDVALLLQRPLDGGAYDVQELWACITEEEAGDFLDCIITLREQVLREMHTTATASRQIVVELEDVNTDQEKEEEAPTEDPLTTAFNLLNRQLFACIQERIQDRADLSSVAGVAETVAAFQNVNVWLLGASGSGKSTLLKAITNDERIVTSSLFRGTTRTQAYMYNYLNFFDTVGIEDWSMWKDEQVIQEVRRADVHVILVVHRLSTRIPPTYEKMLAYVRNQFPFTPIIIVLTNYLLQLPAGHLDECLQYFLQLRKKYHTDIVGVDSLPSGVQQAPYNLERLLGIIANNINPTAIASLLVSVGQRQSSFFRAVLHQIGLKILNVYCQVNPSNASNALKTWFQGNEQSARIFMGLHRGSCYALKHHPHLPVGMQFQRDANCWVADKPIPQVVSDYYFEVHVSDLEESVGVQVWRTDFWVLYEPSGTITAGKNRFMMAGFGSGAYVGCLVQRSPSSPSKVRIAFIVDGQVLSTIRMQVSDAQFSLVPVVGLMRTHRAVSDCCRCNLGQKPFRWDQHLPAMFKTALGSPGLKNDMSFCLKRCRSSKPVLYGYLDSPNSSFASAAALPSVPSFPQL
eukprot:GGOE01000498.1.p1 GENE.GGOE01000498.1~~GGOE01000498.1.p1  ORF type:complete len:881 (-),score=226.42 GGOE01000498.1:145-2787(-)